MKKVIVAGGAGFIGRNAILPLIEKGYEIHILDIKKIELPYDKNKIIWHQADINDFSAVKNIFKRVKPTHLLSFAWFTKHREYWNSSENLQCVNANYNLLRSFVENNGKRVVIAGSCAEYDWTYGVCNELTTPLNPSTLYGACKVAMFHIFNAFLKSHNISGAWGRIFFTFGPFEYKERLIAYVINSILLGKTAKCGCGLQIRDFLSVCEIGKAFAELLDCNVRGAVNIASGEPVAIKQAVNMVCNILNAENSVVFADRCNNVEPKVILADTTILEEKVGYKRKITLKEQLENTVNWWKRFYSEKERLL